MIAGGLVKRIRAEFLFQYAQQTERFSLALVAAVIGKGGWAPSIEPSRFASEAQIRPFLERNSWEGLELLRKSIKEKEDTERISAALDSV
jgi:hypothetical protein